MTLKKFKNKFSRALNREIRKMGNQPTGVLASDQVEYLHNMYTRKGEPDMKKFAKEVLFISTFEGDTE